MILNNIRDRMNELRLLREEAARVSLAVGGKKDTPLLVAVDRSAEDIETLLAEVERLSAQRSDVSLRNMVIGYLRADGCTVLEPGEATAGLDAEFGGPPEDAEEEPLPEDTPFDEPEPAPPVEYHRGMTVRLVGNGLFADRHAILHDKTPTGIWFGELTASTFKPTKDVPTLLLGSFATTLPDPDENQPPLFPKEAPNPPTDATSAPKPTRTPEAPKPVSDWNPSDKEIGEMAALIGNGHTLESTRAMLAKYKAEKSNEPPRQRWRPDFVFKWAKAQSSPTK